MDELRILENAYREAEEAIRVAEIHTGKLAVPALNEMRYAGYHALQCLLAKDSTSRDTACTKAISHCRRAYFDARSLLLLFLYSRVLNIRAGLGKYLHFFAEMVGEHYTELKTNVVGARRMIEGIENFRRDQVKWQSRDDFFRCCDPHIRACYACVTAYENIAEELCGKVDKARNKENYQRIILWLTIFGTFVAILGFVVNLLREILPNRGP